MTSSGCAGRSPHPTTPGRLPARRRHGIEATYLTQETLVKANKKAAAEISPPMRELSTYIAGALKRPLPKEVVEKTKHHVLDTIAAMVSGSRLLPGTKAIGYVKTLGGTKEATVIGSRIVTSAQHAALANGMLGHADETDDSHAPSLCHPGCAIVPAALAMAEREGASGTTFLRAVALGYDVGTRMNLVMHPYEFRTVGHSSRSEEHTSELQSP